MEETSTLRPYSFGQLYGATFALMRRTPSALIIAFVILVGIGVLQAFGTISYLDKMVEAAATGGLTKGATPDEAGKGMEILFQGMGVMFLSSTLNLAGAVFVMTMLTMAGWFAINGENLRPGELLSLTFGRPFWMSLIQTIMLLFFVVLIYFIVLIFVVAIGGPNAQSSLGYVASLVLLYPLISTSFRVHSIVAQDRGPWRGMIASIALANSNFWRVLGALVIPAALAWGVWYVTGGNQSAFSMGGGEDGLTLEAARAIRNQMTLGSLLLTGALNAVFLIFLSYLLTPLYVDLRARRGDFDPELEETYGH